MKAGSVAAVAALSLLQLAAAQPHQAHQHRHGRRGVVIQYQTVTQQPVKVILYKDADGNVFSSTTVTLGQPEATPPPGDDDNADDNADDGAASNVQVQNVDYVAPPAGSSSAEAAAVTPAPDYNQPASSAEAPASSSPESSPSSAASAEPSSPPATGGGGSGTGITYTPYTNGGQCKTADDINSDFDKMKEFSIVRLYGTDCGQLDTCVNAAKQRGIKLFLGIPKEKATAQGVGGEVEKIAQALGGSWDVIHTIAVGNEHVHHGGSAGDVVAAVKAAREALSSKGYNGPVVAPETPGALLDNPQLCEASDYIAANIHAFFDPNVSADKAGAHVTKIAKNVADKCNGKKVVITESGWPSQGTSNSAAVPSKDNQQKALSSIKESCGGAGLQYFLFSAFNEGWKSDGEFFCEKFWGIM